jgi:hypothetical protein
MGYQAARGCNQQKCQQIILYRLATVVLIQRYLVAEGFSPPAQEPDEVMKGTKRTDPPAEEPPEENGQYNGNQGPQEACIEDMGGKQGAQGD